MTAEEQKEWREKAFQVMTDHLTAVIGWPNCHNALVLGQLAAMWNLLGEHGLIKPGMTYQEFCHWAQLKYQEAELNRILGL